VVAGAVRPNGRRLGCRHGESKLGRRVDPQ
jgi:hypothetical protein